MAERPEGPAEQPGGTAVVVSMAAMEDSARTYGTEAGSSGSLRRAAEETEGTENSTSSALQGLGATVARWTPPSLRSLSPMRSLAFIEAR